MKKPSETNTCQLKQVAGLRRHLEWIGVACVSNLTVIQN
jgi:hypothetical protein